MPAIEIPVLPEVPSKIQDPVCGWMSSASSASLITFKGLRSIVSSADDAQRILKRTA